MMNNDGPGVVGIALTAYSVNGGQIVAANAGQRAQAQTESIRMNATSTSSSSHSIPAVIPHSDLIPFSKSLELPINDATDNSTVQHGRLASTNEIALNGTQKRPVGTPPSSSNPSPPKRPRMSMKMTFRAGERKEDGMEIDSVPSPSSLGSSLRPLPLPVLLLIQAHLHQSALVTPIAPSPQSSSKQNEASIYADRWVEWMRKAGATIAALRSVIATSGESAGIGGSKIELRARCELAEILIREMEGTAEAEKVISKGHVSLADYKYRLYSLQAELSIAQGNTKFAKATLKRAIADILSSPLLAYPAWLYHYYLTLASISNNDEDYPGALANLREVERLAEKRDDVEMKWTSKVLIARLALEEREFGTAERMIVEVAKMMGFANQVETKGETTSPITQEQDQGHLGRQLRIQFLLIYCLYYAQNGQVKLAKEKLKVAHVLLDESQLEDGEAEGWTAITIRAGDTLQPYSARSSSTSVAGSSPHPSSDKTTPATTAVKLATSPCSLIYSFAFLASVAIHRDPYGSKPRSKLFANEGLRTLDNKLNGSETWMRPNIPPNQMAASLAVVAQMKVELLIFSAELDIMRSAFTNAEELLSTAIATARAHVGLWESFQRRITLAHGTLAQARHQPELAMKCFEVVVRLPNPHREKDLVLLARMSIIMLKISQGSRVRIVEESITASARRLQTTNGGAKSQQQELMELNRMTKELVGSIANSVTPPALQLVSEFLQALTRGEIIKAKLHLSVALNVSNTSLANHAKALMLALLANLFLHTRNDQAQKMLKASFTILRGMGARVEGGDPENTVGNARLGSWVGERLLEIYQSTKDDARAIKQQSFNEAHRKAI